MKYEDAKIILGVTAYDVRAQSLRHVWLFETPRTVAHQAPLSMGFSQARVLEWVASFFSRGSSRPRDQIHVSCVAGGFLTTEPLRKPTACLHLHNLLVIPCMPTTQDTTAEMKSMKPGAV